MGAVSAHRTANIKWGISKRCKRWLLQNVERGSRTMAKLRGANRSNTASMARSSKCINRARRPMAFKKGVCLEWGAHPARSLTLSLCSLSATIATWHLVHHQERMAYPIRKTCDLRIFPIEMILNKYFLEKTPNDENKHTLSTDTNKHPFICSATACDRHGIDDSLERVPSLVTVSVPSLSRLCSVSTPYPKNSAQRKHPKVTTLFRLSVPSLFRLSMPCNVDTQ